MLANLITTILLALGVATGNVSSNVYKGGNAFNNETEINRTKPIKKAIQNFSLQLGWEQVATLNSDIGGNYKYYIEGNKNYSAPVGNLYNTAYMGSYRLSNNQSVNSKLAEIIRIDPYRNLTNNDIKLTFSIYYQVVSQQGQTAQKDIHFVWQSYATTQNLDEYIDNTIYYMDRDNSQYNIEIDQSKLIDSGYNEGVVYLASSTSHIEIPEIEINNLNYTQPIWIYLRSNAYHTEQWYNDQFININPNVFEWTGQYIEENYEVVDIPNLMFTILTMPFSWYSTAFNLTVFPGTPYALNFGNLILTMVAALTLLYIIKKILK